MKKILSLLSAVIITSSSATGVVSCSKNEALNQYLNAVKNKETFIFFIHAKDCPDCKKTIKKMWNKNNAISTEKNVSIEGGGILNSTVWSTYLDDYAKKFASVTDEKLATVKNMHFYSYETDKVSSTFKDDQVKKITQVIIDTYTKEHQISGQKYKKFTLSDAGLTGVPFFMYFYKGVYKGFTQGAMTDPYSMVATVSHYLISGDTSKFNVPSSRKPQ